MNEPELILRPGDQVFRLKKPGVIGTVVDYPRQHHGVRCVRVRWKRNVRYVHLRTLGKLPNNPPA